MIIEQVIKDQILQLMEEEEEELKEVDLIEIKKESKGGSRKKLKNKFN